MRNMRTKTRLLFIMLAVLLTAIATLLCVNFLTEKENTMKAEAAHTVTMPRFGIFGDGLIVINKASYTICFISSDTNVVLDDTTGGITMSGGEQLYLQPGYSVRRNWYTTDSLQVVGLVFTKVQGRWGAAGFTLPQINNVNASYAVNGTMYFMCAFSNYWDLVNQFNCSPSISDIQTMTTKGKVTIGNTIYTYKPAAKGYNIATRTTRIAVPQGATHTYDGTQKQGVATSSAYTITKGPTDPATGNYLQRRLGSNNESKATYSGAANTIPSSYEYRHYTVNVTPNAGYCWMDGTTTTQTVYWHINDRKVNELSTNRIITKAYTGAEVSFVSNDIDLRYGTTARFVLATPSTGFMYDYYTQNYQYRTYNGSTWSAWTTGLPTEVGTYRISFKILTLGRNTNGSYGGNLDNSSGSTKTFGRNESDSITLYITGTLADARITIPATSYTYTGSEINPTLTVRHGNTTLKLDADYTVSYSNNVAAGKATATITGSGNFSGTKSITYTINVKDITNDGNFVVAGVTAQDYTGSEIKPTPYVWFNGSTASSFTGLGYSYSYENNINAGTAKLTVTGSGSIKGSKTISFTISRLDVASTITVGSLSARTYTAAAIEPEPTVKFGNTTLDTTNHYSLSYANNTNVGTATVTITGKGNFSGTRTVDFTINAHDIKSGVTLSGVRSDTYYSYTGKAITPAPSVYFGGIKLSNVNNKDYKLTYTNNTNAGVATLTVTGQGNFTGNKSLTFNIRTYLSNATTVVSSIPSCTYDGTAKTVPSTFSITAGGNKLTSQDYKLSYKNNTDAGTATVTITPINTPLYGTVEITRTFVINKANPTFGNKYVNVGINSTTDVTQTVFANTQFTGLTTANGNLMSTSFNSTYITSAGLGSNGGGSNYQNFYITVKNIPTTNQRITVRYAGNSNYNAASFYVYVTVGTPANSAYIVDNSGNKLYYTTLKEAYDALGTSYSNQTVYIRGEVTVTETLKLDKNITIATDPDSPPNSQGRLVKAEVLTAPMLQVTKEGASVNISGIALNGNKVTGGVLEIDAKDVALTITDAWLTEGVNLGGNGGVISFGKDTNGTYYTGANIAITGTTITYNGYTMSASGASTDKGGVIYLPAGNDLTMDLTDKAICGNEAQEGGFIFAEGNTNISITGGRYFANAAKFNGGLIAQAADATDTNITITDAYIHDNSAGNTAEPTSGNGGAIYLPGSSSLTISGNTQITNNLALNSLDEKGTGKGGAIYVTDQCEFTLESGTFTNNVANYGGAIYIAATTNDESEKKGFKLDGGTMNTNSAISFGNGIATEGQTISLDGSTNASGITDEIGIRYMGEKTDEQGDAYTDGSIDITSTTIAHNIYIKFENTQKQTNATKLDEETGTVTATGDIKEYVTSSAKTSAGNKIIPTSTLGSYVKVANAELEFNAEAVDERGNLIDTLVLQNSSVEVARAYLPKESGDGYEWRTFLSIQHAINTIANIQKGQTNPEQIPLYLVEEENNAVSPSTTRDEVIIAETLIVPEGANIALASIKKTVSSNTDESGNTVIESTYSASESPVTIRRGDSLFAEMINVDSGATLTLGSTNYTYTDENGTTTTTTTAGVTLDGGAEYTNGKPIVTDENGGAGTAVTNNRGITAYAPVIVNNGSLTVNSGTTITNNDNNSAAPGESFGSQYYGGGIRNQGKGDLTMNGGTIENCYSREGGAIMNVNKADTSGYVEGGSPSVTINGGTISNNVSQMKGAAIQTIYGGANTTVTGGTIENNYSVNDLGTLSVEEGASLTVDSTKKPAGIGDDSITLAAGSQTIGDVTSTNSNLVYIYNDYDKGSTTKPGYIEGNSAPEFNLGGSASLNGNIHLDSPSTVELTNDDGTKSEKPYAPSINASGFTGNTLDGSNGVVNIIVDTDRSISNSVVTRKPVAGETALDELFNVVNEVNGKLEPISASSDFSNRYTYVETDADGNEVIKYGGYDITITQTEAGKVIVNGVADSSLKEITVNIGGVEKTITIENCELKETVFDLVGSDGTSKPTDPNDPLPNISVSATYGEGVSAVTMEKEAENAVKVVIVDSVTGTIITPTSDEDNPNSSDTYYLSTETDAQGDKIYKPLADGILPNDIYVDESGKATVKYGESGTSIEIAVGVRKQTPADVKSTLNDISNSSITINSSGDLEYNLQYTDNTDPSNPVIKYVYNNDEWKSSDSGKVVFDGLSSEIEYTVVYRAKADTSEGSTSLPGEIVVSSDTYKPLTAEQNTDKTDYETAYNKVDGIVSYQAKEGVYVALAEFEKLSDNKLNNVKGLKAAEYEKLIAKAEGLANYELDMKIAELYGTEVDVNKLSEAAQEVIKKLKDDIAAIQSGLDDTTNEDGSTKKTYADLDLMVEKANAKLDIIASYDKILENLKAEYPTVNVEDLSGIVDLTKIYNDALASIDADETTLGETAKIVTTAQKNMGKQEQNILITNYITETDTKNTRISQTIEDTITAAQGGIGSAATAEDAKKIADAAKLVIDKVRAVEEIKQAVKSLKNISQTEADKILADYFGTTTDADGNTVPAIIPAAETTLDKQTSKEAIELETTRAIAQLIIEDNRAKLESYIRTDLAGTNDEKKLAAANEILNNALADIEMLVITEGMSAEEIAALPGKIDAILKEVVGDSEAEDEAKKKGTALVAVDSYDENTFKTNHGNILDKVVGDIEYDDIEKIDAALDELSTYISKSQEELNEKYCKDLIKKKQEALVDYINSLQTALEESLSEDGKNQLATVVQAIKDSINDQTATDSVADNATANAALDGLRESGAEDIGKTLIDIYVKENGTDEGRDTTERINAVIEAAKAELDKLGTTGTGDDTTFTPITAEDIKNIIAGSSLELDKAWATDEILARSEALTNLTNTDESKKAAEDIIEKYLGEADADGNYTGGEIAKATNTAEAEFITDLAIAKLEIEDKRAELINNIKFAANGDELNDPNEAAKIDKLNQILNDALAAIETLEEEVLGKGLTADVIAEKQAEINEKLKEVVGDSEATDEADKVGTALVAVDSYDEEQLNNLHQDILDLADDVVNYSNIDAINAAIEYFDSLIPESKDKLFDYKSELIEKKKDAITDYVQSFKDGTDLDAEIDEILANIEAVTAGDDYNFADIADDSLDIIWSDTPIRVADFLINEYINAGATSENVENALEEYLDAIDKLIHPDLENPDTFVPATKEDILEVVEEAKIAIDVERYKDLNEVSRVEFDDIGSGDIESLEQALAEYADLEQNIKDMMDKEAQAAGYETYEDLLEDMIHKAEFEQEKEEALAEVNSSIRTHDSQAVLDILEENVAAIQEQLEYLPHFTVDGFVQEGVPQDVPSVAQLLADLEKAKEKAEIEIAHAQKQQVIETQISKAADEALNSGKYNEDQKAIIEGIITQALLDVEAVDPGTDREEAALAIAKLDQIATEALVDLAQVPVISISTGGLKPDLTPVDPDADDYNQPDPDTVWGVVTNDVSMPGGIQLVIEKVDSNKMDKIEEAAKSDKVKVAEGNELSEGEIKTLIEKKEIKTSLDIYLLQDGNIITEFDGYYEIKLLLTPQLRSMVGLQVVYVADDGSVEVFKTSIEDNKYLTFTTKHFSEFFILGEPEVNLWWLIIVLSSILALEAAAIVYLSYRRNKLAVVEGEPVENATKSDKPLEEAEEKANISRKKAPKDEEKNK